MDHPSHEHSLILNVNYNAREGDVCRGCNEQIVSCNSSIYSCSHSNITNGISAEKIAGDQLRDFMSGRTSTISVSCARFLLHKKCAELPAYIQNPTNPKDFLNLCFNYSSGTLLLLLINKIPPVHSCKVCCIPLPWQVIQFFYCSSHTNDIYVCLKCAMLQLQKSLEDSKIDHLAHRQHPLALIRRPSSFTCDACNLEDNNNDLSYICTKCQFWMHKSCAEAPTNLWFQFHYQHPLVLSFSLPQIYHKFIQYCRLCKKKLNRSDWLYYCRYCRFFAHFQCARSSQMTRTSEYEEENCDLVYLPAADESTVILLGENNIKSMSTLYDNNYLKFLWLWCLIIRQGGVPSDISPNSIKHWGHDKYHLQLMTDIMPNSIKHWAHDKHHLQLMTIDELNYQRDNDEILLICDGCIKPIQTDDDQQFYGCVPCKYFLHTFCAELPRKIEHYFWPGGTMFADKYSENYELFSCDGCGVSCNGIFFSDGMFINLHIGCVTLPKVIKHGAHIHKLNQVLNRVGFTYCQACGKTFDFGCQYGCKQCDVHICNECIMIPRTVNHRWDPHPLHLIYDPDMVNDHEHDFICEYCSEDIDPNFWFYHCTDCDLSFHLNPCFERSRYNEYSNVKFGATDIIIHELHPHSLTFVLNKRVRSCEKCHRKQFGKPVLQCNAACKAIFCTSCCKGLL